ncbi:MAG: hypothetical protein QOG79_7020 [Mycobacterium sp.]|nr:hypothetical protein [Mycobacterium sp.]
MSRPTRQLTDDQIRIGATAGIAHVAIALVAHFAVPVSLAPRLGLVADPWFRRETGTVNAGFADGLLQLARGRRDPTFLRATAISGLLMATVRAVVIGSDLLLGIGGLEPRQFDRNNPAAWPPGFNPALAQRCPPMHRSRDLEEVLP